MSKKGKITADNSKVSDFLKWSLALVLFLAGFAANYYFESLPLTLRLVGWVVLACLIVLVIIQTTVGKKGWVFFKAARGEMRKVIWPTRHETFQTTFIVIAIIIVFAVVMWAADSLLLRAIGWLTGQ